MIVVVTPQMRHTWPDDHYWDIDGDDLYIVNGQDEAVAVYRVWESVSKVNQ